MKLLRWTLAGASFYVVYKYAIGKKAKGEDVFETPEDLENPVDDKPVGRAAQPTSAKKRKPKTPSGD